MVVLLAFALTGASASTTLTSVSSGVVTRFGTDTDCGSAEAVNVSAEGNFSLPSNAVVDVTGIQVLVEGRHGPCEVTVDTVELLLDGVSVWSTTVSRSSGTRPCCDWYLSLAVAPPDIARKVLSSGTHTLKARVNGEVESADEAISVQVLADVEYGRDWDNDGYDSDKVGGTDCDDNDRFISPGAVERCDGLDNDCDGVTDGADAVDSFELWLDADGDAYGDQDDLTPARTCTVLPGHALVPGDCDDADAAINPGAAEVCDGVDNDCDLRVDDADANLSSGFKFYTDGDGDGYGPDGSEYLACRAGAGEVKYGGDCNDRLAGINPGAKELWYDGVDQDCDGNDRDQDYDGYPSWVVGGDDCNDRRWDVNPAQTEVWYDGLDQDCDGLSDYDYDGDGYDSESYGGDDCDDGDTGVNPGAPDVPYDGVVSDCSPEDEYDVDQDGYSSADHGGSDCDDANSSVAPGQEELWYDGVDQDCDGNDDDQDRDGYPVDEDCDDLDAAVFPGAVGWSEDCQEATETFVTGDDGPEAPQGDAVWADAAVSGGGGVLCGALPAAGGWAAAVGALALLRRRRRPTTAVTGGPGGA